jgi:DNA-binding CsgD family transcriptional regulator
MRAPEEVRWQPGPQARLPYLAVIVVDAACNVELSSRAECATGEDQFLSRSGTRLHPDLEAVVSKLVGQGLGSLASPSSVAALDAERRVRVSPLSCSDGIRFAVIVERARTRDPIGRAVQRFKLTRRQTEVLALLLDGASAGEIADQLTISEYTAQGYIKSLLAKTASRNRAAMVARVLEWEHPTG